MKHAQRFLWIDIAAHAIASTFQQARDQGYQQLVIVHVEYMFAQHASFLCTAAGPAKAGTANRRCVVRRRPRCREIDLKRRARAQCTIDRYNRLVFLQNTMHHSHPQAGAFARGFGGKERFKDAPQRHLIHSCTIVTYRESRVNARL